MITPADAAMLRRIVGPRTFARATSYALGGAVRSLEWFEDGSRVIGVVQGGAREPYRASVKLTRSPSAKLAAVQGTCSCPVGVNCKHVVALLLAKGTASELPGRPALRPPGERSLRLVDPPSRPAGGRSTAPNAPGSPTVPPVAGWELPLRAVVDQDGQQIAGGRRIGGRYTDDAELIGELRPAEIGLQFQLVQARAKPGQRSGTLGPGIRIRPVVSGRSGTWVKTGISWANLEYHSYTQSRSGTGSDKVNVLKELLALSRVSSSRAFYTYTETDVWLEAISSRRLWDLLREARDLQVPLIGSGRKAQPITLRSSPASVAVNLTRAGSALQLQPHIDIDDEGVPLGSSIFIGSPAHGLVWWDEPSTSRTTSTSTSETPPLKLAPLSAPLDGTLRALLGGDALTVPKADEPRFFRDFYPTLRRRIALVSSDESVELPSVPPTILVLSVRHDRDHHIELTWAWDGAETRWGERLWETRRGFRGRSEEDTTVEAVTKAFSSMPELIESTAIGERPVPEARLEGMEAVRFVSELLPLLDELPGLRIQHDGPAVDYREIVEAPVVNMRGSGSGDGDWFDLTVDVRVGGEEVPFAELFVALAEERSHLILPSGAYFSLDRPELRRLAELITEARALRDASGDGVRLSRFQASLWEDLESLGVITAQAGAWEESVRGLVGATDRAEYPTPRSLRAVLRPYQRDGFNWLALLFEHRLGGVLADDMGLGKTLQALALMCHTRERGLTEAPFLVVAPTSVVENWAAECRRFAPDLAPVTVTATEARRGAPLAELVAGVDVVITSYALFRLEYDDYEGIEWAALFLDEAQFAKNRASHAYRRAKTLPVPFKVAMTGTPMENNLMELWSLLSIAAPGLFANPDRFAEYYQLQIEKRGDAERLDQLRRRVRPLMLRRTKEQVAADLPDKQEQVLELELTPRHKKLYQTYLARERQKILGLIDDMSKNRFEIFRSLTLLRQASLDVSLVDPAHAKVPSTKLDALMEMLDDIVEDGHRVLVFSQFTRFLAMARQRLDTAGIEHCYLDGSTRKREAVLSEFRTGAAPVFLISLKAGGLGLNLTEADYCILLDPWWNPATEAQAVDRIHRIGQTRKVMVYRLVAKDTIEEKVMALKAKKAALFANVVDAGGFESGALTAGDIRGLLS